MTPGGWEAVDTGDPDDFVDRLRVSVGWIYRTTYYVPNPPEDDHLYVQAVAMVFVPDMDNRA